MIKLENYEVVGWEHAIRGMRNPMNSWDRMDSDYRPIICSRCDDCDTYYNETWEDCDDCEVAKIVENAPDGFMVGPNDHDLMMRLAKGGPVHAKYRRMITVYVDITAPLYWWKEMDTYKVGTVANSCSTMHKIHAKEFELSDFSFEDMTDEDDYPLPICTMIIDELNYAREKFLEYKDKPLKEESKRAGLRKKYWKRMIKLLPTSYNQKRTVMLNYEVLHNIYESRRNHKLDEWHVLCDWIEKLPYSEVIMKKSEPEVVPDMTISDWWSKANLPERTEKEIEEYQKLIQEEYERLFARRNECPWIKKEETND